MIIVKSDRSVKFLYVLGFLYIFYEFFNMIFIFVLGGGFGFIFI